ncbi:MAG: MBOAT family O-acyltransferase [Pseudomonadota bacterium]
MIFNSLPFILLFLPLCYAGFILTHRGLGWPGAYAFLVVASIVFYAQFNILLALVLVGSITFNFLIGRAIQTLPDRTAARMLMLAAIAVNLVALGYFKYVNFFIDIANSVSGEGFSHLDILVPVGVSFFTFTQIGYLIEASAGRARQVNFVKYALFAGFFPCVTAGPLLLQREMFDQMDSRKDSAFSPARVSIALTMFGIGLAKKVLIADSIAPFSNTVFDGVAAGQAIALTEAWVGSLCYTLQLYFDFSGYSDMAIGIAFLFGFKLPLNFNSPFKATSISEFWSRWHMTMTRFFTTFIYTHFAMTNARRAHEQDYGPMRKWLSAGAAPVFYTFLIAGIWHGAGWTFVVYGLIHGTALAINHGWREFGFMKLPPLAGWFLTMLVVVMGLVVFRAQDLGTAGTILVTMWGLSDLFLTFETTEIVSVSLYPAVLAILTGGVVVLAMPNSQEILRSQWMSCDKMPENIKASKSWIRWSPTAAWAACVGLLIVIAATSLNDTSGFLYYDF